MRLQRLSTCMLILCAHGPPCSAQRVSWDVIASGGVMISSSPAHCMAATVGQAIVGVQNGSPHTIFAGFWNPALEVPSPITGPFDLLPASFHLSVNCPNPFCNQTTLFYAVPRACHLALTIYDVQGRLIYLLQNGPTSPGFHTSRWDGRDLAGRLMGSGIYVAHLSARAWNQIVYETDHAMILVR